MDPDRAVPTGTSDLGLHSLTMRNLRHLKYCIYVSPVSLGRQMIGILNDFFLPTCVIIEAGR